MSIFVGNKSAIKQNKFTIEITFVITNKKDATCKNGAPLALPSYKQSRKAPLDIRRRNERKFFFFLWAKLYIDAWYGQTNGSFV